METKTKYQSSYDGSPRQAPEGFPRELLEGATFTQDQIEHAMDVKRFRFCYFGDGVVLQETDGIESYLLSHGPYRNSQEAWSAMEAILDGKPAPKPKFRNTDQAA